MHTTCQFIKILVFPITRKILKTAVTFIQLEIKRNIYFISRADTIKIQQNMHESKKWNKELIPGYDLKDGQSTFSIDTVIEKK